MYILQSKVDGRSFEVDQRVIDASELLKNVCDLTEVTEPLTVDCPSEALSLFINLINHYKTLTDKHDTVFEKKLLGEFDDDRLVQLVNELSLLDSDFFLDSVADIILDRIKNMYWQELQQYFQLDDDFSTEEREAEMMRPLKYLFSVNSGVLAYPFLNTHFPSLKNRFYTPMNVLLARIIQRSNHITAFQLSLTNKTMKNENDRHPFKVEQFSCGDKWYLYSTYGALILSREEEMLEGDSQFFDAIAKRKLMVDKDVTLGYCSRNATYANVLRASSLDFVFPSKSCSTLNVKFSGNKKQIYDYDSSRSNFSSVSYSFYSIKMSIAEFYKQLVAKDLSKEIHIHCEDVFQVFHREHIIHDTDFQVFTYDEFEMFKKPNATRFHKMVVPRNIIYHIPEFKKFIMDSGLLMDYMEKDGIVTGKRKLFDIPNSYDRKKKIYYYTVSDVIEFLNRDPDAVYCKCRTGCQANTRCKCRRMERMCNSRCHFLKTKRCCNE